MQWDILFCESSSFVFTSKTYKQLVRSMPLDCAVEVSKTTCWKQNGVDATFGTYYIASRF